MNKLIFALLFVCGSSWAQLPRPPSHFRIAPSAEEISSTLFTELSKESDGPDGRPLPFMSHWTTGSHAYSVGWSPINQMQWIEQQGHYLLPWFAFPEGDVAINATYYNEALAKARSYRLPITLVASQWERYLSQAPYIGLPADQNPNVVLVTGEIQGRVSPFGPVEHWRTLGRTLVQKVGMRQLQDLYPDPTKVIMLSNNEHVKLRWTEVETEARYMALYGAGRSNEFKRKVVADGWVERYGALIEGMREGFTHEAWRTNSVFVGYNAFGPVHFGRWYDWAIYSLHYTGVIDPSPLVWEGGSTSFYTSDWSPITDFKTWSPQIEFMNLIFQQKEAYATRKNFWFELSTWDGYDPGQPDDKRAYYVSLGQTYTPTRYAGMVKFGMWLNRPRVVREFRGWTHSYANGAPYFLSLVAVVDQIHDNHALAEWWRHGKLVANLAHAHPYQSAIPPEYANVERWFLLDANVNSQTYPWSLSQEIAVFALALVRGETPNREWLIYAHSPVVDRAGVVLTIPDYGNVQVDVPVGGVYYEVSENGAIEALR